MSDEQTPKAAGAPKGHGSFCVPRAAVQALLDAHATAYEICTYLVLAKHTEESGRFSPASISAVNKATGANKVKGGPVDRALARLKQIQARRTSKVSNGRSGKSHQMVDQVVDLGPLIIDRDTWLSQHPEVALPDGPTERGQIRFVLADFGEPLEERVWIGNNLVGGVRGFGQPLKALKNAGDVAARLLLAMYASNDMESWGGVRPIDPEMGPWTRYEPVSDDTALKGGARLVRAKDQGIVGPGAMFARAWPPSESPWWSAHTKAGGPVWRALEALETIGLVYEVVMVLNRNAEKKKFSGGEEYSAIPKDAEPFYELDARSKHGYKPQGEEGLAGMTARTAGDLGHPVATEGGRFDGTYAAIVPQGFPAMIAGIYRLRFRVANPKNAGVKGTWARIHQNNREALELIQAVRSANKLVPLDPPSRLREPVTTDAMAV